ncbi:MAG: hypothetical protein KAR45_18125 [Desulfobacteraceae bacterium]|nr:hypothetical protein [Desulfobacteraceae bacterium]
MKTILISTRRADFKFIFHCGINNLIIHGILPEKISYAKYAIYLKPAYD